MGSEVRVNKLVGDHQKATGSLTITLPLAILQCSQKHVFDFFFLHTVLFECDNSVLHFPTTQCESKKRIMHVHKCLVQ